MAEGRAMLRRWEEGDEETVAIWRMMNSWVYAGFDETYERMGVSFDKIYYESETYLEGKEKVEEGLEKGLFYRREDGSVWADLTKDGLDEKLLLRSDGTSVYMTQDIGTAKPTAAELAAAPPPLIDIISPLESYSAADFVGDCVRLVNEIHTRGRYPLIVGGTMMYFHAASRDVFCL